MEEKDGSLVPAPGHPIQETDIQQEKNEAVLPLLRSFTKEFSDRIASGQLDEELGKMKAATLIGLFAKIAAVLKPSGPQVGIVIQTPNPQRLQTFSARKLTPEERERLHRRMDKERGT